MTWPLNRNEAGGDLVLIKTWLLLLCKSSRSNASYVHVNHKSSQVCIKAGLPPASLPFKGQGPISGRSWKVFTTRKPEENLKPYTLLTCVIQIFLTWTEFLFIQVVSGICTSLFLDMDDVKMALQAWKVFGAFNKSTPGHWAENCKMVYWNLSPKNSV